MAPPPGGAAICCSQLDARETSEVCLVMGLIGLTMVCYCGLYAIPTGVTKSSDHPRRRLEKTWTKNMAGVYMSHTYTCKYTYAYG